MSVQAARTNNSGDAPGPSEPNELLSIPSVDPNQPNTRMFHVTINSTLKELASDESASVWAPAQDKLKSIFHQTKFDSINGSAAKYGNLKSVVLHSLSVMNVESNAPFAIGMDVSGVDNMTYTKNGDAFSHIVTPNAKHYVERELQKDDTKLVYEFASEFPGYGPDNADTLGVYKVPARNFVLLSEHHPIIAAINENAADMQVSHMERMPEGLVKVGLSTYEHFAPVVKRQLDSQIKVRNLQNLQVRASPVDAHWGKTRSSMITAATRADSEISRLKAEAAEGGAEIKAAAEAKMKIRRNAIEDATDATPIRVDATYKMVYNFLSDNGAAAQ